MKEHTTVRLAGILRILVTAALAVNVVAVLLVPSAVILNAEDLLDGVREFLHGLLFPGEDDIVMAGYMGIFLAWAWVWGEGMAATLTCGTLVACGGCTAGILLQGRRVLDAILKGEPFSGENAVSLRRAAFCSFGISGVALVRLLWGLWRFRSLQPLATYNALFIPAFAMAGLLLLVMSALFRQAAELKAEQDLTI